MPGFTGGGQVESQSRVQVVKLCIQAWFAASQKGSETSSVNLKIKQKKIFIALSLLLAAEVKKLNSQVISYVWAWEDGGEAGEAEETTVLSKQVRSSWLCRKEGGGSRSLLPVLASPARQHPHPGFVTDESGWHRCGSSFAPGTFRRALTSSWSCPGSLGWLFTACHRLALGCLLF